MEAGSTDTSGSSRYCPYCGARQAGDAAYCRSCGAALGASAVDPVPLTPAQAQAEPRRTGRFLAKLAAGCVSLLVVACVVLLVVASVPSAAGLALGVGGALFTVIVYGSIILSLDRYEKEPWRTLLGAFGWGAAGAILLSVLAELANEAILTAAYGPDVAAVVGTGLSAPIIEETFKGVALLGLLWMFRDEFDNVLDGLVYGALIGLGFTMTEDILYLGSSYVEGGFAGFSELFVARSVIGGLGHSLYTGTTGAAVGWARAQHGRGVWRFIVPILGWGLAVFQHFLWNSSIFVLAVLMGDAASTILAVAIEAVLYIVPAALVLYAVAVIAGRREARVMREQLADEVAAGVLTQDELHTASDGKLRRRALWRTYRQGGFAAWALQRRFFQAAAELAFRKYHLSRGERPKREQKRTPEAEYREQLAGLRARLTASAASTPPPQL